MNVFNNNITEVYTFKGIECPAHKTSTDTALCECVTTLERLIYFESVLFCGSEDNSSRRNT